MAECCGLNTNKCFCLHSNSVPLYQLFVYMSIVYVLVVKILVHLLGCLRVVVYVLLFTCCLRFVVYVLLFTCCCLRVVYMLFTFCCLRVCLLFVCCIEVNCSYVDSWLPITNSHSVTHPLS